MAVNIYYNKLNPCYFSIIYSVEFKTEYRKNFHTACKTVTTLTETFRNVCIRQERERLQEEEAERQRKLAQEREAKLREEQQRQALARLQEAQELAREREEKRRAEEREREEKERNELLLHTQHSVSHNSTEVKSKCTQARVLYVCQNLKTRLNLSAWPM